MRIPRIHCRDPLPEKGPVRLEPAAARRLRRVLRLADGAPLVLFDGGGAEHRARLARDAAGADIAVVEAVTQPRRESSLRLRIAQGVAKGERMDWIVQKAVELGVTTVQPLVTERTVVRLDGARARRRLEHWRAVAVAACEQCGRTRLPAVEPPRTFRDWIASADAPLRLLLDPEAEEGLPRHPSSPAAVDLLVGPEGGLAPGERTAALAAGFRPVRLGPRVLRTETAAVVALALVQHRYGDLR
ncbi:16S rRNA (uracil(1498)-N(3))-methyltransferase [Inmirania thermothiophila]|uniref:Ribosomal RNA small subunit methyltransferase E n=1 Tax=Inmirania thermothiophila TaxID=1750597 RepID=A0A3N1Y5T3_9GAMM|nr:16S rRNA (uracil(1498)-N(3))-methyltransferase [Inmirania thermothiophila]ROR34169.1 16S rRNA (uracil1498-N3)-methyltransferase [Inmirania thermothiophila]